MTIEYENTYTRSVAIEGVRGYKKCYLPYYFPNYNANIVDEGISKSLLKHIKRKQ